MFTEIFLFSDQPATCYRCGSRTEIIIDLINSPKRTQYHQCLSNICKFTFILEEDIEMPEYGKTTLEP